jgi:hypothetical protein
MTDTRRPVSRCADRDVADLPVRGQFTQQNEVADAALKRLLMQFRAEHLHVELRTDRGIRNHNVQMLEAEIFQRKRGLYGRLSPPGRR